MSKINEFFKVKKLEVGKFDYDTIFIEVDSKEVQIPILKEIVKSDLVGKSIKIKSSSANGETIFSNVVEKLELI